jgi:hypothetical protein
VTTTGVAILFLGALRVSMPKKEPTPPYLSAD